MDDNKCSEYESVTQNAHILPPSLLNHFFHNRLTLNLFPFEYTSTSHILHVSSFLPPDPSSYYYYFFLLLTLSLEGDGRAEVWGWG